MHTFPKLHNAMWPGLVGKGPGSEPAIGLEAMLKLTAAAKVDGVGFDGVDLFLAEPHTPIDASPGDIAHLADLVASHGLVIGSCVAPVWPDKGGGSAMGDAGARAAYVDMVRKACGIASRLRELGIRTANVIRADSAVSPGVWASDPSATRIIAATLREAASVCADHGERLALEGEICWGGMHSWRHMLDLLEAVGRPGVVGFQADMAHTLLYAMGYNAPEHALVAADAVKAGAPALEQALVVIADALRPWTIDFHVAQNDGSVKGMGEHDNTGRHCLPDDPAGLLDIPRHAGLWLRDGSGKPTRMMHHLCWDGCMFPNSTLLDPETWQRVLTVMLAVRAAHGWSEPV
ncbi:MAG: TIM barrel protein [Bradyrhizobium sp.]|nr:TIM barrel protein [Bradyrhizobium sp.]